MVLKGHRFKQNPPRPPIQINDNTSFEEPEFPTNIPPIPPIDFDAYDITEEPVIQAMLKTTLAFGIIMLCKALILLYWRLVINPSIRRRRQEARTMIDEMIQALLSGNNTFAT